MQSQNFGGLVGYEGVRVVGFDPFGDGLDGLMQVFGGIADSCDADNGCLVAIVSANFSIGYIEFVAHSFEHRFDNAAFLFE